MSQVMKMSRLYAPTLKEDPAKEGKFTIEEAKSFFGLTDHEAESILRDFMLNDQTP